jgi:catabolite regulation protein CreA
MVSLNKNARVTMRLYSLRGQTLEYLLYNQSLTAGNRNRSIITGKK